MKKLQDKKKIFLECWKARKWLRLHGFLTESDNKRITGKLLQYQAQNDLTISDKDLQK